MRARWLRAVLLAACIVLAVVATASVARADCTPAAANNVTATCSGTTTNQGGGAPGTSAQVNGYGNGLQTGVTVNVVAGAANTVTGSHSGINLGDGTVTNNTGASITGLSYFGIFADTNVTVTNNAGASITGASHGIFASTGFANVTNSGSITGTGVGGIYASADATVTNNAGASITGDQHGIFAQFGFANVTNSGSITGAGVNGIFAFTNVTVTNNAGGSITGGLSGIFADFGSANVTNSGSITGQNGISGNANSTVTNNAGGSIVANTFTGVSLVGGGSSVFNAGTISGATEAIRFTGTGNTLTLAPGSAITGNVLGAGSDTFQLGGAGSATFNVSQLGAAAQYRGFGTFNKISSSTWTLTGTSTFAGVVNVNGGTLRVDGSIASSSLATVNSGALLTGTGTVGSTTINSGGSLLSGNGTAGTSLAISGNLAFQSGATYLVAVNPATASFTSVTGTATLGGATVTAAFAPGSYISRRYTIVTANGGVAGTFAANTVNTNLPANFHTGLSYDANHAYLDLILNFSIPGGLNGNQQAVGNALTNYFNSNGSIAMTYAALSAAGLSQASGELGTGAQQATFQAMGQFMGLLTDPFAARNGGDGTAPGATGFAESAYAATRREDAFAMLTKAAPATVQRWSVWGAGFGGAQTTDGNTVAGTNGSTSRIYGTAVGADYLLAPNTLAGFALAGGGTSFAVNGFGTGRSDLFQAGGYFRHNSGPFYLAGALAYGWQDISTDRTVTIAGVDRLHAAFKANAWSGRLEGGYRFVAPWTGGIGITPYAAGQVTIFELPAYAEQALAGTPAFALAYGAKSVTDTRSELGLRTDKSFAMPNAILTLRGRAAWAHDFNPDRAVSATFLALPGASFVVNGARPAADSALTTASAEMKWINGWSAAATFEGEFSGVTHSYAGKGILRYVW